MPPNGRMNRLLRNRWPRLWMRFAGTGVVGRLATRLAGAFAPPYKGRRYLARLRNGPYVSPSACVHHGDVQFDRHAFIGDRVVIYSTDGSGTVRIGEGTNLHQDSIVETGNGGALVVREQTHIQPRCQFSAYLGTIEIGRGVQIAPACAFYPYDHFIDETGRVHNDQLRTRGGIRIEDNVWLGYGVIVLDGVTIGRGAVIGAGSVVKSDIPGGTIAVGSPARVVRTIAPADEAIE